MDRKGTKQEFQTLKIEIEDHILLLTLNRPQVLNAMNQQMLDEINKVLDLIIMDKAIYGMIITGEGRAFVAGADIAQMQSYQCEEGREYAGYAQQTFSRVESLTKPVIAAVNGFALGGGCELALSCDIRIASEKAVFGQPESLLGIIPCFGGTQRLPRLVGSGVAKEMIFTGRQVRAEEAFQIGLVNRVVSSKDLLQEAKSFMRKILEVSPSAIKYAKLSINKGMDMDLQNGLELEKDLVGICFALQDKKIGMAAFLEKKKPQFRLD